VLDPVVPVVASQRPALAAKEPRPGWRCRFEPTDFRKRVRVCRAAFNDDDLEIRPRLSEYR
jgi:hypothetical protein